MANDQELKRLADHHDYEARGSNEIRRKFESGEVFSLSGVYASDHDAWVKEMIATYSRLELEHLALRDGYRQKIASLTA